MCYRKKVDGSLLIHASAEYHVIDPFAECRQEWLGTVGVKFKTDIHGILCFQKIGGEPGDKLSSEGTDESETDTSLSAGNMFHGTDSIIQNGQ